MNNPQGTISDENHRAVTTNREAPDSSPDGKLFSNGIPNQTSALDNLLETEPAFCRKLSMDLAGILTRLKCPEFLIEDLIQEAWMHAVLHEDQFDSYSVEEVKRRLHGLLGKVVHDKGVDLLRHLACFPGQSLDAGGIEPIDDGEAKRTVTAELREQLNALLARLHQEEPENSRLLYQRYMEGRTIQELAEERGWTAHEVSCRIYRAKQKIRSWVSQSGPDGEDAF